MGSPTGPVASTAIRWFKDRMSAHRRRNCAPDKALFHSFLNIFRIYITARRINGKPPSSGTSKQKMSGKELADFALSAAGIDGMIDGKDFSIHDREQVPGTSLEKSTLEIYVNCLHRR